ncbi:hypothetical protein Hamer_G020081, partial [Homarus americanus]
MESKYFNAEGRYSTSIRGGIRHYCKVAALIKNKEGECFVGTRVNNVHRGLPTLHTRNLDDERCDSVNY